MLIGRADAPSSTRCFATRAIGLVAATWGVALKASAVVAAATASLLTASLLTALLLPASLLPASLVTASLLISAVANADDAPISARAIDLRGRQALGELTIVRAYELDASDRRFGGLSGMALLDGGRRVLAITDNGLFVVFDLDRDEEGHVAGFGPAHFVAMTNATGGPLAAGFGDSEELQILKSGDVLVSFEHEHRLATFGPASAFLPASISAAGGGLTPKETPFRTPAGLARAPKNGGLEAVLALDDGRVFAAREKPSDHTGQHPAWLWTSDEGPIDNLVYRTEGGFQPTAFAHLSTSVAIGLERRYTMMDGIAGRLVRFQIPTAQATEPVRSVELGRFGDGQPCDNFEAMVTERRSAGGHWVFLLADDNFNPTQHGYFLQLSLPE